MKKICQNCEMYTMCEDKIKICSNDYSPRCGDEVGDYDTCGHFENSDDRARQEEFDLEFDYGGFER